MLYKWDRHVITNVSGLPLSESYVVPRDEVVLEGRCRDFSMLRKFNVAPDTMIRWRFLPVKWVSTPSTSQANSAVESITLQLDRLSDLASNNKGNTLPRVYQQLIDSLHEHRVSVLLCCEDVDEEWIHYAASRSVTLVSGQEGMPMMYLPFPLDLTDMNALLSMLLLLFVIVINYQLFFRGLVKWHHRGLQNLYRGFDSHSPCQDIFYRVIDLARYLMPCPKQIYGLDRSYFCLCNTKKVKMLL